MKIVKFGGSSVGTPRGLGQIKKIVETSSPQPPVVVVVSALGGVTDQLIRASSLASDGRDQELAELLEQIRQRHHQAVDDSVVPQHRGQLHPQIDTLLDQLRADLGQITQSGTLTPQMAAQIVAYGELLSSQIVARIFDQSLHVDSRQIIKTIPYFDRHIIDFPLTNTLIRQQLGNTGGIVVMGGFISSDRDNGQTTNLGRGGSDYTAALVAAATGASLLEIYTDVDGFMTADPRIIPQARLIDRMSFVESMELCNFGAKVIYAPTIFPAYNQSIPIAIRNTYNTDCAGTLITDSQPSSPQHNTLIKGVTSVSDTSLITVRGLGAVGEVGAYYRVFRCLATVGVGVLLVARGQGENSISIAIRTADTHAATKAISSEFRLEIEARTTGEIETRNGLTTIAIVGQNLRTSQGAAERLYGLLGRSGIDIIASTQWSTHTSISFIIETEQARKTIEIIHENYLLTDRRVMNLALVGTRSVGRRLLDEIGRRAAHIEEQHSMEMRVVCLSDGERAIIDPNGIDFQEICRHTEPHGGNLRGTNQQRGDLRDIDIQAAVDSGTKLSPAQLASKLTSLNLTDLIFVDTTASQEIADAYHHLLSNGIWVVASNKAAASSSLENYHRMLQTASRRGVRMIYNTNIGGGLPAIKTLASLSRSGDSVHTIRAVVSTTLNYLFNVISPELPFSRALAKAVEEGYAEPDPRADLMGIDSARKLIIMAREAGYSVEVANVKTEPLITDDLATMTYEEFIEKLPKLDEKFERLRAEAQSEGKVLRYVATMKRGVCQARLEKIAPQTPFYHLPDNENVVLIGSERYREYPLQIKGCEAGPQTTAQALMRDILTACGVE